jgi:hypothetical protein
MVVGDKLAPDADAVLWATAAIIVAHHHLVDPRVPSDRVAARGLVERAIALMQKASTDSRLAMAAAYRIALAVAVRDGVWRCDVPLPRAAELSGDSVEEQICLSNDEVRLSAAVNAALDPIEQTWAETVGAWLSRTLPTSEAIFRRVHHRDASRELHDWKRTMGSQVTGLLRGFGNSNDKLRQTTLRFIQTATAMVRTKNSASRTLIPHINQAALLLDRDDLRLPEDESGRDYQCLMLNNLWTPEMVAADLPQA